MKKLIVSLGIVAIAAGLQAVTYNWSAKSGQAVFNGWEAPTTGSLWSGATAQAGLSYYLIYADTLAQGDLLAGLRGGKTMADYTSSTISSGTTTSDGIANFVFSTDSDKFALDSSDAMSVYFAVLASDDSAVYLTGTSSKAADLGGGQVDYSIATKTSKILCDNTGSADYGSAGWYAVPEPTSGLLMLLGMAGLALRRKRA